MTNDKIEIRVFEGENEGIDKADRKKNKQTLEESTFPQRLMSSSPALNILLSLLCCPSALLFSLCVALL